MGEETAGLAIEPAERALGGERVEVTLDPKRAGEAEVRLDFAQRRRHAVLAMVGVDEVENLLLPVGEGFAHGVQVNTFESESKPGDWAGG